MAITELECTGINVSWFKVLGEVLSSSTICVTSCVLQRVAQVAIRTGKLHKFLMQLWNKWQK